MTIFLLLFYFGPLQANPCGNDLLRDRVQIDLHRGEAGLWATASDTYTLYSDQKNRPGRPISLGWEPARTSTAQINSFVRRIYPRGSQATAKLTMYTTANETILGEPQPLDDLWVWGLWRPTMDVLKGIHQKPKYLRYEIQSRKVGPEFMLVCGEVDQSREGDCSLEFPANKMLDVAFRRKIEKFSSPGLQSRGITTSHREMLDALAEVVATKILGVSASIR